MDFLEDKLLLYEGGELIPANTLIHDRVLILYYFTSMQCSACRDFDVRLKKVYAKAMELSTDVLIIIVCTDDSSSVMYSGLSNYYPDWYAIPFDDELRIILRYNYEVTHVPQVIVVRQNGKVVTRCGRNEIEEIGINVLVTWSE